MLSMRLTVAIIAMALTVPALGLLAGRNVEASVLFAGLAATLGVLMLAVLLAAALTRPLVEIADAVQALARNKSVEPNHGGDQPHHNIVTSQPHAQRMPMVIAPVKTASGPTAPAGVIASPDKLTNTHAAGKYIDFVIPSDRRA
jgi:hypothetical protein